MCAQNAVKSIASARNNITNNSIGSNPYRVIFSIYTTAKT